MGRDDDGSAAAESSEPHRSVELVAAFSAMQRAELRDSIARSRLDAEREAKQRNREWALEKAAPGPAKKRRLRKKVELPPKSEGQPRKPKAVEMSLAECLLPHVCVDSVVDRRAHALGVARMVLNMGAGR